MKKLSLLATLVLSAGFLRAQDSTIVKAHPSYNQHGKLHRIWFGENYRKEWAAETKVPLIKISEIKGGLTPTERGGGHQTHSLRLIDKKGKEWVLRTIEKFPEVLIPEALRNTFAKDWVDDNMSAQHPYAALIVPTLAEAVGIPHSKPIIGLVAPDSALGKFAADFENKLCLLEEREPLGKSDNTAKMLENLDEDSENRVNAESFLKAQLLDVVIGDWDRHADQWRWKDIKDGQGKNYIAVPRDRDQVFYVNQGTFPSLASREWLLPFLQGYDSRVRNINTYLWESRLMASRILNELSFEQWMSITRNLIKSLPDEVLEASLKHLPASSYQLRHDELLAKMKSQRDNLLAESEKFYRFINKVVEIKASDKNEFFSFTGGRDSLKVEVYRLGKENRDLVFSKNISPVFTKEVWVYTANGNDTVFVDNESPIRIRIVSAEGHKAFDGKQATRKVKVYARQSDGVFRGDENAFKKRLSNDSLNAAYVPINRYNINMPIITGGFNKDDGLILGAGIKHTHQGFRKVPYASQHQFTVAHSFSTSAFRIKYSGDWIGIVGKADLGVNAAVLGPNNTINFYGRGNETQRVYGLGADVYYRSRFNQVLLESALKWKKAGGLTFSAGPAFQYYTFEKAENAGRFMENVHQIGSYDSTSLTKDKLHGGLSLTLVKDNRSSKIIPVSGMFFQLKVQALAGLSSYARSFAQVTPELRWFQKLTKDSALVIADRVGGGLTFGKSAFYQSLFLGGHDNLLGFHQYRFAGQHLLYNNFEMRLRLAKLSTYILPGELGLTGFYDVGRVWEKGEKSDVWHHGTGGGIYLAPAYYAVVQFIAGYSKEGWYPYIKLSTRF